MHDAYYWERIGFRAAWISVTQVPFIYLLAGKVNVLGMVLGSSYMDLNWVHRWVARTLLVTATIHGSFFIREWVRADFFQGELELMPMVKWGLAAWGILAWTTISSLFPLRRLCYEFFVVQHLASGAIFLWVLHTHVPSYAAYNIWMAAAFFLSGRVLRACIFLFQNLSSSGMGYYAGLKAMPDNITRVTIRDIKFTWKPGQHVLLWCPSLGLLESHPFTLANIPQEDRSGHRKEMQLIIRARSGFTQRLYRKAASMRRDKSSTTRAFVTGPLGNLPAWNTFETLVLISASTGASFTLPILESILNDPCCVSRLDCMFLVRQRSHIEAYMPQLQAAATHPRALELQLRIMVAVTGDDEDSHPHDNAAAERKSLSSSSTSSKGLPINSSNLESLNPGQLALHLFTNGLTCKPTHDEEKSLSTVNAHQTPQRSPPPLYTHGRPNLSAIIRNAVEASAGETSVVVCGGKSLTSDVRTYVSSLADERAVHKGTGAQGIRLHVEGFGS